MKPDDNELILRHYINGLKGLAAYSSIITIIEHYIASVDLERMKAGIVSLRQETKDLSSRFYMIESRVKTIEEMLTKKCQVLEQEKEKALRQKPLVIRKRSVAPKNDHVERNK